MSDWDADTELSLVLVQLRKHRDRVDAVMRNTREPIGRAKWFPVMTHHLDNTIAAITTFLGPPKEIETTGKVVTHD